MLKYSRPLVLISLSAVVLTLLLATFFSQRRPAPLSSDFDIPSAPPVGSTRGLHYILPGTSTNLEACKLLFTGTALGFPDPILIGWGGHGRWNGSENHLFKFPVLKEYFAALRPDQDDDLVFLLDAFDIWFQLPPEVLIKRYYRSIEKENGRLKRAGILNRKSSQGVPIRNTVLFGADRLCWPSGFDAVSRVPCEFSPESLMSQYSLGPMTDVGPATENPATRPKFLNSGTIIGPVKDVRDLFQATYDRINQVYDNSKFDMKNSDQHYLHTLWGWQEEARQKLADGSISVDPSGPRTEFGVTIDDEGDAYQLSLYHEYITWMSYNHSAERIMDQEKAITTGRLDQLELEQAIMDSPPPFAGVEGVDRSWKDLMLGMSVISGNVFPLFHITPQKYIRGNWWPRMWFHPYGRALQEAGRRKWLGNVAENGEHVVATVDGVRYVAVDASRGQAEQSARARDESNPKGGVWNDLGSYMPWDDICAKHEKGVFLS